MGIGAVISQKDEKGLEYVIAYTSRTLRGPEKNYHTTVLECLAITWAVKQFKHYVYGSNFTVFTDHKPLETLMTKDSTNNQLQRMAMQLQDYRTDMVIKYREGKKNVVADALSRAPINIVATISHEINKTMLNTTRHNNWDE